jgi:Carbohydrate-selective porin, OprB family
MVNSLKNYSTRQSINYMSKLLSNNFLASILISLAVWVAGTSPAPANQLQEQAPLKVKDALDNKISTEPNTEQVEQAIAATEIKPGDWAYQTLQALNTRYNCSNTPISKQTLSREEFATSLNGCIQSMEQLVARKQRKPLKKRRAVPAPAVVTPPPVVPEVIPPAPEPTPVAPPAPLEPEVSQQDLDRLKQLVQAFGTELQAVDTRLQTIEASTKKLQDQSFSTTTKLVGEVIIGVNGLSGDRVAVPSGSPQGAKLSNNNTILADRVRLNFRSSFTGKDLLLVRLQSRNLNSFGAAIGGTGPNPSGTNMNRLGYEGSEDNATSIHRLQYQLPLSSQTKVFVEAVGSEFNDNFYNFNPEHQAAGTGSITRFGRFNPVYRLSNEGAGISVDQKITPNLGFVLGYAVPRVNGVETVNNPAASNGLFNGSNVIFSQLAFKPSDGLNLGLIYARSYHSLGSGVSANTGSGFANTPFGAGAQVSADNYSVLASVDLSKSFVLSGWAGYTSANREGAIAGKADIWNYAVTLAARDFGAKGNTLGFVVGVPPKVTSNSFAVSTTNPTGRKDNDTSLHLEAFYKYKLSDNITVTPGILMLLNPEHNAANPTQYLGTIRTTFSF